MMVLNILINVALLVLLLVLGLQILKQQSPLTVVILSGLYSFTLCALFVVLDAVDVAFTEAAVGAGIATVLVVSVVRLADEPRPDAPARAVSWPAPTTVGIALATAAMLLFGTLDMPGYGDPTAPVHNHLAPRFLGQSGAEIGIPNVVTSILASYRGYDTLGEVVVIFTAGVAVLILLAGPGAASAAPKSTLLLDNAILRRTIVGMIPLVLLFALYVQFHGDYGPGGGFQAGVIFGAGLITWGLLAGPNRLLEVIPRRWMTMGMVLGVLLYGLVGVVAVLLGGEFLNYSVLAASPTAGQHLGILVIEFGVGLTVASTMLSLYASFYTVPEHE